MNEQKIHYGHSFSHFFNDLSVLGCMPIYSRLFSDFHEDIEKFHSFKKFHDFSIIKVKKNRIPRLSQVKVIFHDFSRGLRVFFLISQGNMYCKYSSEAS